MRIVHLSDIHQQLDWRRRSWVSTGWRGVPGRIELHQLGRLKRFADAHARWAQILDDVTALDADHVFLTGDLTALGHRDELETVARTLEPLLAQGRLTLVPGNHDRYVGAAHFEAVFGHALGTELPEYADASGYPFVRLLGEDAAVVGLDSTRVPGWAQYVVGRVGGAQRGALSRLLGDQRLEGRTIHVLSHHGPWGPAGVPDWREAALLDGVKLLEVLHGHRVVLHHGHSHLRTWHAADAGRPHLFGGGSSTEPGRAGYWVLEVEDHHRVEAQHLTPGRRLAVS